MAFAIVTKFKNMHYSYSVHTMMRIQTATAFATTNTTYQCKSSLANAQYVALQQYFSPPRLVIYFPIVTHTSETGMPICGPATVFLTSKI